MAGRTRRASKQDDRGQMTLMIIGFAVIVLLLVTVVTNASKAFLWRRSISSYADAAALAASQSVGEAGIYSSDLTATLPVTERDATDAVDDFIAVAGLRGHFPDLRREVDVAPDGTVTVTLVTTMPLAFVNGVSDGYGGGVTVAGTASSQALLG